MIEGERFIEGQVVELATIFKDKATGEPTNPHSVRYSFRSPSGSITRNEAPTNPSTGLWRALLALSESNTWWYRCEGRNEAGELVGVSQGPIEVEKSQVV